jgi:hypothetical protein
MSAEDQPWYRPWREALDRVIAAQMERDRTNAGTPEPEAAEREHDAALVAFRTVAQQIPPH